MIDTPVFLYEWIMFHLFCESFRWNFDLAKKGLQISSRKIWGM